MKKFMESLLLILMFSHFQEEEEIQLMLEMDHKSQPIGPASHKRNITINITRKILVKEISTKKFMELLLLTLMSSHFQEEEEIQPMLVTDHKFPPTGLVSHRRNITINIIRKILVKEISTKKFMELPQLILMYSHFQEEEEILPMLEMDHRFQPTGQVFHRRNITINITRKILVKEILMKKFMVLLPLTPTFFHFQEEEEILLMLEMDHKSQPTGLVFPKSITDITISIIKKILEKVTLMKKFMELLLLILMYFLFQEEEEILPMLEMDHKSQLDGLVLPKILPINKLELMSIQLLTT